MKILVTGGNGFIGSRVVQLLHDQGHSLRLVLREKSNRRALNGIIFEEYLADIRTIDWDDALVGCDAVIHAASISSWEKLDSPELDDIIVKATKRLVDAAAKRKIRLVYVSSAATLGASKRPDEIRNETSIFNLDAKHFRYAALKYEAEQYCLAAVENKTGDIVVVNPGETYGPGDYNGITSGSLVDFCKGPVCLVCNGGITLAHVADVANGIAAALENGVPGKRYHLAGEMISLKRLAQMTLEISGKQKTILTVPHFILHIYNALFSFIRIGALSKSVVKHKYAMHYWYADNANATSELGATFRGTSDTLESTIQWLKEVGRIET